MIANFAIRLLAHYAVLTGAPEVPPPPPPVVVEAPVVESGHLMAGPVVTLDDGAGYTFDTGLTEAAAAEGPGLEWSDESAKLCEVWSGFCGIGPDGRYLTR